MVTKMELERSALLTMCSTSILEEARKRMPTTETARERVSTLLGHRVVRVDTGIELSSELGCREDLVGFVESCHLAF